MKRRDFIKLSSTAGVAGVVGSHFDAAANPLYAQQASGFDLHPFIKAHPEAVFVYLTDVKEKTDQKGTYDAGHKLASEMFVQTSGGAGFPNSTKIACKPNWTCVPQDRNDPGLMGIITDLGFTEGYCNGIKSKGPQQIYLRDCACPVQWEQLGFVEMAKRNNFDLTDVVSKDPWEYGEGDIVYKKIDNGVVLKEIPYQGPMVAPDSFLVNIAKYKTHAYVGITTAVKNLQGIAARRIHRFCGFGDPFRQLEEGYHRFFIPNYLDRIAELHKQHVEAGVPRWNERMERSPFNSGLLTEQWAQRMCDSYSVIPMMSAGINVVEGIYWREGDFQHGPHDGKAMDFMVNMSLFGKDAFRIDVISHWLAGHEPGNFGLFHIGIERGFLDVLDPFDIPVYLWENGSARKIELTELKRTPLLTNYIGRKEGEDLYRLCNEPFDYKAWKETGKIARIEPSIKVIGTDSNNHIVMDMSVPEKGDVYVDILNSRGEAVWSMHAPDLEPGSHQVVWDGFDQPGMYNTYVKGMEWDAENEMVIYT